MLPQAKLAADGKTVIAFKRHLSVRPARYKSESYIVVERKIERAECA